MLARVPQDVRECVSSLARRPQHARVESIREHAPRSTANPVEAASDPNAERAHAPRQCRRVARFDDQVNVIRQHRDLDDAHAEPRARDAQDSEEQRVGLDSPQARDSIRQAQRHEQGVARRELRARRVRHQWSRSSRLAPYTGPRATVPGELQLDQTLETATLRTTHRVRALVHDEEDERAGARWRFRGADSRFGQNGRIETGDSHVARGGRRSRSRSAPNQESARSAAPRHLVPPTHAHTTTAVDASHSARAARELRRIKCPSGAQPRASSPTDTALTVKRDVAGTRARAARSLRRIKRSCRAHASHRGAASVPAEEAAAFTNQRFADELKSLSSP